MTQEVVFKPIKIVLENSEEAGVFANMLESATESPNITDPEIKAAIRLRNMLSECSI